MRYIFLILLLIPAGVGLSGISYDPDRADVGDVSLTGAVVTVGTTQVEAKVGATRNSKRQRLLIYNGSAAIVYYGATGVTTATGVPVFKKQVAVLPIGDVPVYLIAGSAGNSIVVQEIE